MDKIAPHPPVRAFYFMEQLTKEMVIASLLPDVVKNNINQLIVAGKNIKISKETIQVNYEDFKKIRAVWELLKDRKDEEDRADKERIKARKEGYDVYMKPLEELLDSAEPIFIQINNEIKREELHVLGIIQKKNEIKIRHIEFVNDTTKMIAAASDNKELVRVQKLIGSEKSKTAFYGDHHPVISEVCDSLLKLVEERKRIIKENDKLKKDYEMWLAAGDIDKAAQLKEEMDHNERVITQNIEYLSEQAYKHVSDVTLADTEFVSASIQPRLHRWSYRVDGIENLYKKRPDLVVKEPNVKAINAFMKEQQETGELNDIDDNKFDGLVIYRKPFFVAIKTAKDAS